jgi:DNA-binding IclR family transcriptional regulator
VLRALVRGAEPRGGAGAGYRCATTLRRLAEQAGLSMLEAHRALHQLLDRRLLQPDLEALSGCLDAPE